MVRSWTVLLGSLTLTELDIELVLFTAPTGYTTVIRDVLFQSYAGTATIFGLRRSTGSASRWLFRTPYSGGELIHYDIRQVMPPGTVVYGSAGGGAGDLSVTGYQFAET